MMYIYNPLFIYHHYHLLYLHFHSSLTIPQLKHSPDPGSAVLGVIGYGQDNDRMVSLPWVVCHALMSALYCCLPLLDVGHCGIAITCSIIDSLVKGGCFGSQLSCPRPGALYSWCWLGRLSWVMMGWRLRFGMG